MLQNEGPNEGNFYVCTHCGYGSTKKFPRDICPRCRMTDWKCNACGYTMVAVSAPAGCPECGKKECFINITAYIPDWYEPLYKIYHSEFEKGLI